MPIQQQNSPVSETARYLINNKLIATDCLKNYAYPGNLRIVSALDPYTKC